MIQLDEIFDCEIIALKKGKNGVYTLKFITKEQKNKNERILERKRKPNLNAFGRTSWGSRGLVENQQNYARTETRTQNREIESENGKTFEESRKPGTQNRENAGGE